ncbi:hypothetical protein ES288_A05G411400v1 [Gossypium darwinii]|uniref:Uncharacterized protein n=1 Tax=Gossypium darwinii TaxID=34276 RepID=A0A5D2GR56_GOSDA|nr:hypothetical protein ES288_A05G411400v1 [Gossypium darwinii]
MGVFGPKSELKRNPPPPISLIPFCRIQKRKPRGSAPFLLLLGRSAHHRSAFPPLRAHRRPSETRCCCGYLGSTRRDKKGLLVAHVSEVRWMVEWDVGERRAARRLKQQL